MFKTLIKPTYSSVLLIALSIAVSFTASANNLHTGSEFGSYHSAFGPLVKDFLAKNFFNYTLKTSAGTGENVARILQNPADIALGQFDVVALLAAERADALTIIRADLANECLIAVTNNPNLTNWGQVQRYASRLKIATAGEQSGSALTFKYLQSIDEGLSEATNMIYAGSAKDAVQKVIDGEALLAFFVQFPDTGNPVFEMINKAKLQFVPVVTRAMLRQQVDGQSIYTPQEITVTSAGWGRGVQKITTSCTKVVLITGNSELVPEGNPRKDHAEMIKVLREAPVGSFQPKAPWYRTMLDNIAETSTSTINSLLEAVETKTGLELK